MTPSPTTGDGFDRAALIAFAQTSIARGSKSFGAASQLFDRRTRERAWLLYAWCRACDDIADGQDHGGAMVSPTDAEALTRAQEIRRLTDVALAGHPSGNAAFDCLGVLVQQCPIPRPFIDALIEGFDRDAAGWRPRSEDDLFSYCWNVAGAVGCMMALVMGVAPDDDDTLDRACDLGIAFQMANIARDVAEDAAADRCYLPLDWLVELDIPPGQHMHPAYRPRLAVMARWLAEYVVQYRLSARVGAARLPFRSRWAVHAAARIYGAIATKVHAAGDRAWDHRIGTSKTEKLGFVLAALVDAVRDGVWPRPADAAVTARSGLWRRPRA
jgi:phytoene synthase